MLMRIFQMAVEEGVISRNPARGIKVKVPSSEQKVLTSDEANKLLREAKLCNHRFYAHWAVGPLYRDEKRRNIRPESV